MNRRRFGLAVCLGLVAPALLAAADWPQWQGPKRDNKSTETGLLKSFPPGGPKLLWTCSNTGRGYSGPAIVGNHVYVLGCRNDAKDFIICLDADNGQEVWATEFAPYYFNGWGGGPRATPTVSDGLVYALGPRGDLACVDAATGKKVWSKSLTKDLGGQLMSGWGYSESPLVDGDRLICCPGGPRGTMAALDKRTGDVVWRSKGLTDKASYSSVVISEGAGVRQYVVLTGSGVVGVAAKDGRLLWRQSGNNYRVAVIPTAVVSGDYVYATTDYGAGCMLLKLSADGQVGVRAEKVYGQSRVMENHHGGVVLVDGNIYGWSGNVNSRGGFVCQDFMTGKEVWRDEALRHACSITYADGHLYCYTQNDGTLACIEATAAGWKETGRFKIPRETTMARKQGKIWTHPVIANGRLYLRDLDLLFCYDLKDGSASR